MDRGVWWATAHGIARIRQDLQRNKQQQQQNEEIVVVSEETCEGKGLFLYYYFYSPFITIY